MNIRNIFKQFMMIVMVALLTGIGISQAEEPELCAPFQDGKVDEPLLATMLSAADDGHLYRIQQASSRMRFCVDSKLSRIEGSFTDFLGGIAIDSGASHDGQTMVLIRADSLDTEAVIVNSMVKGENFFDVERYPEILFISNDFHWTGSKTAVLKGDLTLRGVTRPVVFNVTLTAIDGEQVSQAQKFLVVATTTIDRTDFGMDKLTAVVSNSVQLCMSVEVLKYEA